jgi:signal transduction histidine kinase
MGLSMAQQIARAHDGRVHHTIETDSGRTVFALELPWPICR